MRRLFGGVLAIALLGSTSELPAQAKKKAGWQASYEAARVLAQRDGKPLLVVFR